MQDPVQDIASRLAEIARSQGETQAVADTTGAMTYAQFEAWTNDLANRIIAAIGMTPRVCLVVAGYDRQGLVGMFATLKTPHIFLPIDRENLPANIAAIAAQFDAGAVRRVGSYRATRFGVDPDQPVGLDRGQLDQRLDIAVEILVATARDSRAVEVVHPTVVGAAQPLSGAATMGDLGPAMATYIRQSVHVATAIARDHYRTIPDVDRGIRTWLGHQTRQPDQGR